MNMKLHELVNLRNLLTASLELDKVRAESLALLQRINRVALHSQDPDLSLHLRGITDYYAGITTLLNGEPAELSQLLASIDSKINNWVETWDQRGYLVNGYIATNRADESHERTARVMPLSDETKKLVQSRIDLYSDWHYPGLEIGPGDGAWTNLLVANDPLYIVDLYQGFLDTTKQRFPREYQARLRAYLCDSSKSLSALPQNQIGLVFAWNVFNFFPQAELKQCLIEIYSVLRPGGAAVFSYNNCDNSIQAKFAEDGWMSWIPKTVLTQLVLDLGFDVIGFFDPEETVSWIEIKKPGVKSTIKAHPVLGEIKNHNS